MQLRRGRLVFGSDIGQRLALRSHAEQLVARVGQRIAAQTGAVLQLHRETAGLAERLDRGRLDRESQRIVEPHERPHGLAHKPLGRTLGSATLAPVLERREHHRVVLTLAEETETAHHDHAFDFLARLPERLDRCDRLVEPFLRRAGGRLHHRDDIALVLGRQEPARQADEQQAGDPRQQQEDRQPAHRAAEDYGIRAPVFLGHAREPAVEAAEKASRCAAALFDPSAPAFGQRARFVRLAFVCRIMILDVFHPQESRAQRGRQRQREHGGEEDRDRESDRELAVDPAGRTGEEGHRQEHRDQDQRDPDDRAGDLVHCLARCRKRAEPFFAHDALDILDHDDRVIDEDADREHHAEQRQHVDRKAEQPQAQTGTGQRDRDHQRRDQRRAPVLQEQEHDEKDQHHRLDQRLDHFLDRNLDEGRGIVGDRPGDIVGQARTDFGHPFVDPLGGC